MGVDVNKKIITGAMFSLKEIGKDFLDQHFLKNNEKTFGDKVHVIQLNPWATETIFSKPYMVGVVDKREEGDGGRSLPEIKESMEAIELNVESAALVKEQLAKFNLTNDTENPIKTYRLVYFT